MNKKGFTLIELLAVIVILAVISLIVIPVVSNVISMVKISADKRSVEGYISAAENLYASTIIDDSKKALLDNETNVFDYLEVNGKKASSGIIKIDSKGNISMMLILNDRCYIKESDQTINEISVSDDKDDCIPLYHEKILNGAYPILSEGMIPALISDNGVVTKADINQEWYNYEDKKWANMVLVNDTSRTIYKKSIPGSVINSSDILGYFVWIPRYRYQLFNVAGSKISVREVNIEFENKDTNRSTGTKNDEWFTPNGFKFDNQEQNGIWLGKFETTGDATTPTVLPNISPISNKSVSGFYNAIALINNDDKYGITTDAHMSRNSEWAVATYLTQSKYGKCTDGTCSQVRLNNVSPFITGCGATVDNADVSTTCDNAYGNVTSYPQSTTSNITGIFDMAGGLNEYVMDRVTSSYDQSGFGKSFPPTKYCAIYSGNLLGEGASEFNSWYGDYYHFVNSYDPWLLRGNSASGKAEAGIFYANSQSGSNFSDTGSRVTVIP